MEVKIDKTYHVASCCCPQYAHEVLAKIVFIRSPLLSSSRFLSMMKTTDFSLKPRVRMKDNNKSPHDKFHGFLFPFSSKFSDLNFAPYVLYTVFTHVT